MEDYFSSRGLRVSRRKAAARAVTRSSALGRRFVESPLPFDYLSDQREERGK